jgi:hypothetical protein
MLSELAQLVPVIQVKNVSDFSLLAPIADCLNHYMGMNEMIFADKNHCIYVHDPALAYFNTKTLYYDNTRQPFVLNY